MNEPRTSSPFEKKPLPKELLGGRRPPADTELEEAVLGALMLERDAYTQVCDILSPEAFYDPANRKVFEAILKLAVAMKPIDMLTVVEQMRLDGTLDSVGGAAFVVALTNKVVSGAHIEFHARIVAQKYLARELISFATVIENSAFDETNDVNDLMQEAEGRLFEISQRNIKKEAVQIDSVINQSLRAMEAAANRENGLSGIPTGYRGIDKITSGWQNSDLIIIAARPAMGKTAFVLSMARNMAVDFNVPVALFSLEMSKIQLVNRLISNVAEVPGEQIKNGSVYKSTTATSNMLNRLTHLFGAPVYVDDTPSLSILELRTKARRLVREHGIRVIIIDYLQLMNASGMKFGSREQEVSTISRSLKQLAKELDIPVIALSQLNRNLESRGTDSKDKRPQLSDLRESGAIEQDADIVCFIHRPEYYLRSDTDAQGQDIRGKAEFIIAKHRSGATDIVDLRFRKEFARFENLDDMEPASGLPDGSAASAMNDSALATTLSGGSASFMAPPPPASDAPPF